MNEVYNVEINCTESMSFFSTDVAAEVTKVLNIETNGKTPIDFLKQLGTAVEKLN